jgi:hypothetical protein
LETLALLVCPVVAEFVSFDVALFVEPAPFPEFETDVPPPAHVLHPVVAKLLLPVVVILALLLPFPVAIDVSPTFPLALVPSVVELVVESFVDAVGLSVIVLGAAGGVGAVGAVGAAGACEGVGCGGVGAAGAVGAAMGAAGCEGAG